LRPSSVRSRSGATIVSFSRSPGAWYLDDTTTNAFEPYPAERTGDDRPAERADPSAHVRPHRHRPAQGRLMLEVGDRIPLEASVWLHPNERHTFEEIVADGPVLLFFYIFDWTST
jgi:hypothetical protein